jgi:hypothetical protein
MARIKRDTDTMHNTVRFRLAIPAAEFLRHYQGTARQILVTADDGRRINFPAEHLRAFVTRTGVEGEFELRFDRRQRFVSLKRLQ